MGPSLRLYASRVMHAPKNLHTHHRRRRMCYLSGVCARERESEEKASLTLYLLTINTHTTYPLTSTAPPPCTPTAATTATADAAAAATTSNKFYYALAKFNQLRQRAIFPSASAIGISLGAGWVVRDCAAAPQAGIKASAAISHSSRRRFTKSRA